MSNPLPSVVPDRVDPGPPVPARRRSHPRRLGAAVCLGVGFAAAGAPAWADPPELASVEPAAVVRGCVVELVLRGKRLQDATGVWTDFPASATVAPGETNGTRDDRVAIWIEASDEAVPGIGALRLVTRDGVSSVRWVAVDDLPVRRDRGGSATREAAERLAPPIGLTGRIDAERSDVWRVDLAGGERLAIEVLAQRLGSPLDPVMRLLDAGGRELVWSDDGAATGADPRIEWEAPAEGPVYIEVRDVSWRGGDGFVYHLRTGRFPLPETTFPLAARPGRTARLEVHGAGTEGRVPVEVGAAGDGPGRRVRAAVRRAGDDAAGFLSVLATAEEAPAEREPNDTAEEAGDLPLPGAVNGRFDHPGDRDVYELAVGGGERWVIRGRARRLGSPADLWMRLLAPDGRELARTDDAAPRQEGRIDQEFPEEGTYRLVVEDLLRAGGAGHVYRLEARRGRPGVELELDTETVNAPHHGWFALPVRCLRRGHEGPVAVRAELDDGRVLGQATIPAEKQETEIRGRLPADLETGTAHRMRVTGAPVGDDGMPDAARRVTASTVPALRRLFERLPWPPPGVDGLVVAGVGPPFPAFLGIELATDEDDASAGVEFDPGDEFVLPVRVERRHGFEGEVRLSVEGLPEGLGCDARSVEAKQREGRLVLHAAGDAVPGKHRARIVARATYREQPGEAAVEVEVAVRPAAMPEREATREGEAETAPE